MVWLLPLFLIRIVSNMLSFGGSVSVKSSNVFQLICCNCYIVFGNTDKNFSEKKKQLARCRAVAQEKYELKRNEENIA